MELHSHAAGKPEPLLISNIFADGIFRVLADDRRDGLKLVAGIEVDEFHAHGVAASLADVPYIRPHHLATDGDEHDFVGVAHGERADHAAGFVAGLHRDDAFAAARLDAVFVKPGAFADAVFARDEQRRVRDHDGRRHECVAGFEIDSAGAASSAAHRAHIGFMEADAHAVLGDEHHVVTRIALAG